MDRETLAQVSRWYYYDELSQHDISRRLGVSRSTVSRLLTDAKSLGIVKIVIENQVDERVHDLSLGLQERFGLDKAIVADDAGGLENQMVAQLAALEVESRIDVGSTMAISYGTAVHATVKALHPQRISDIQVVQMAAVEGARNPAVDGWELVKTCARKFGGRYNYLYGPLIAHDHALKAELLRDPTIARCFELTRKADLAIVGIGSMVPEYSSLVRAGHLTADQLSVYSRAGSVGYIAAQHYDRDGRPIESLNELTMSVPLTQLAELPCVLAVATGEHKREALLGALRGGYVHVLATDVATALLLLREEPQTHQNKTTRTKK